MNKSRSSWLRVVLPGVVLAALGFSYALVTSTPAQATAGRSVESRATIGTNCARIPTQFVTPTDLGLVVAGTQFTRQMVVELGFKPHEFSFGRIKPAGNISISKSGTISGKEPKAGTDIFEVICADDIGGDIKPATLKTFIITAVDIQTEPALSENIINSSKLPDAVANDPYTFTLHANGGLPPYEFFPVDSATGALPPGLALSVTGQLSGKPINPTPTPFLFTVGLLDSTRLVVFQDFTLNVRPGTISSDLVATRGSLNLNFGTDGSKDGLKLSLFFNKADLSRAGIRTVADLKGVNFAMDFGGIALPQRVSATSLNTQTKSTTNTTFDASGSIRQPNLLTATGGVIPKKTDPRYEINLNPATGELKLNFQNVDLIKGLGANFNSFKDPVIPISVKIGTPADQSIDSSVDPGTSGGTTGGTQSANPNVNFDHTDSIQFLYRRKGSKGKASAAKNVKNPSGGIFLVRKVDGKSDRQATNNDIITMNISGLIRLPGGKPITPGASDSVQVLLADKCLGDFPSSSLSVNGDRITFSNTDPRAGLKDLVIDNKKGTFTLTTFSFNTRDLFDQDILEAGRPFSVPLTLTIANTTTPAATPTFDGQTSIVLFRKGNRLVNK